jgi:gamma-glutamyltranspeptidase/glutathione hydrolase
LGLFIAARDWAGCRRVRKLAASLLLFVAIAVAAADVPIAIEPVVARHAIVVSGHPEATAIGVAVLRGGGNAIDAAVATSLALGVAEPYASGLGGKLMLLFYEAKSGKTCAVDGMDAAGSLDPAAYARRPEADRSYGYASAGVPGLPAGLWLAHRRWGAQPWADDVRPAAELARRGVTVVPKTRDFFEEQERKLRRGDAEIARLYLPGGELPAVGAVLRNPDLAGSLDVLAAQGADGFYRGPIGRAIMSASRAHGGVLTLADFAEYEARISEPVEIDFRGIRVVSAPPPTMGSALFLPALKVLEDESFARLPLRSPGNLEVLARVWEAISPQAWNRIGDVPEARFEFERFIAPDAIRAMREKALAPAAALKTGWLAPAADYESAVAATTHFIVVDAGGNIVCATQSLGVHFGAGVVPPGTGIVLNNSMSNFTYSNPADANFPAPGKRARSTIAPTIAFRDGRPVLAIGVPGAARIPTTLLQVLLDRLALGRGLAEAIGDTRVHFVTTAQSDDVDTIEAEGSFPAADAAILRQRGWKLELSEEAGRGRRFAGVNAVEFAADGTLSAVADPRRSNAAAGY